VTLVVRITAFPIIPALARVAPFLKGLISSYPFRCLRSDLAATVQMTGGDHSTMGACSGTRKDSKTISLSLGQWAYGAQIGNCRHSRIIENDLGYKTKPPEG